jgi:hypothetical protein
VAVDSLSWQDKKPDSLTRSRRTESAGKQRSVVLLESSVTRSFGEICSKVLGVDFLIESRMGRTPHVFHFFAPQQIAQTEAEETMASKAAT